jgi:hypothetical protein
LVRFEDRQVTMEGPGRFAFRLPDPGHLILEGPFFVRLHRVDDKQIPLISRGFHWVQEFPFNR